MQPTLDFFREQLRIVLDDKTAQGRQTAGLYDQLAALPSSYDALARSADCLADLPLRENWPDVEPNNLDEIWAECDQIGLSVSSARSPRRKAHAATPQPL